MPIYAPKNVVLNWYQYDISPSIELITSFVEGIEAQVDESIAKFENEKESFFLEEYPEANLARFVEVHQGLDGEAWDLRGIFVDDLPNYQRRSVLVFLSSFFEHKLDELCLLYQSEHSYKLLPSDLSGKGITRSTNYLRKVVEIEVYKDSEIWEHIQNIQKLRNIIVHQAGKLTGLINDVKKYIEQIASLDGKNEVIIKSGFLGFVISKFGAYFKLLGDSILKKENG